MKPTSEVKGYVRQLKGQAMHGFWLIQRLRAVKDLNSSKKFILYYPTKLIYSIYYDIIYKVFENNLLLLLAR